MTAIILDLNTPDPAAPVTLEQTLANCAKFQQADWVVSQNLSTSELTNKVKKGPFQ